MLFKEEKMKSLFLSLLVTLMVFSVFCRHTDAASVTLTWTAVGDDSTSGIAFANDMRFAQDSTALVTDWSNCQQIQGLPAPKPAGQTETLVINNFPVGQLWFYSVKSIDEAGNVGALGNITRVFVPDDIAPAAIVDLRWIQP